MILQANQIYIFQGEYFPVEIQPEEGETNQKGKSANQQGKDVLPRGGTGGTFQIRQGQQKRIKFKVSVLRNPGSGSLPLDIAGVSSVAVGGEVLRGKTAANGSTPLDSYQGLLDTKNLTNNFLLI